MSADGQNQDPGASASGPIQTDALKPGELFDRRYRIVKKLGEGGMGEVYAAKHEHIEKRVAIKVLRPEIVTNKEAVARFAQEARSASGIGHKNIIGIDDFGYLADGRIYLSMEFLDGMALNDMIKAPGGLPHDRLLNIMIQTGHGLSAAHARGIVHRDMKPENIFITHQNNEDVPKLLDFGIAKVAGNDGQNNLTRTGTIFGTPFYMAPEQAMGQQIDGRVDIYAMGVILYEVFAGSLPFRGESFMGILTQHITTEPEPVANRAGAAGRQLPPGIPEIVHRAMAKDPVHRFQTMDELVNALVAVYRQVAGSGMSQYMEAHQGPRSAMMSTPGGMPSTGAHAAAPGHSGPAGQGSPMSATQHHGMVPAPHAGAMTPAPHAGAMTPQAGMMPGYGQPQPGMMPGQQPYQQQHPHGMTPGPMAVNAQSSQFGAADGSMMMPAKKSKAGLIFAIIAVLAVVGGGIAVFMVMQNKNAEESAKSDDGDGDDKGTDGDEIGSGTDKAGVVPDAGSGSQVAMVIDAGIGSGSQAVVVIDASTAVAVVIDAAVTPVAIDAGVIAVAPPDAAVAPRIEPITVLVDANAKGATIWENGKKLGKAPDMFKIIPGEPRTFVIKAKNHKDEEVVVDGSQNKVAVKLERKGGGGGGDGPGTGTGTGTRPPDPPPELTPAQKRALYCKKHPDDIKCEIEP